MAEIYAKHPMAYWVKLPVRNEKLMTQSKIRLAAGSIYTDRSNNHICISKAFPDKEQYEAGIAGLRAFIDES